ncbi:MAG: NADH:flavin oxidoreductase, partial [Candidatus Poribacteria bacterium]|nr:NADH:flavin oxidoreductase [Candidatus Poribacteria bacterium]
MSQKQSFRRIASFKTIDDFREHLEHLGLELPTDDAILTGSDSPLLKPIQFGERTIGNRWCVQPMEGWDGTTTGGVTESMNRRWQRFGMSGAKLIWGGEAMAVRPDGRANPNQLVINKANQAGIASLREALLSMHRERYGNTDDLLIGFQLTHSGRFSRPDDKKTLEPPIACPHPFLDRKFGITSDAAVLSDDEVKRLIDDYVAAAAITYSVGAEFVDIKHCHGYLLHEFLGAHTRPGPYGGSFENRTRILCEIVSGIRAQVPELEIGVRLSTFDFVPFKPHPDQSTATKLGPGIPEVYDDVLPYRYAFGVNPENPIAYDLDEPERFLALIESLGIRLVNLTAGSPY